MHQPQPALINGRERRDMTNDSIRDAREQGDFRIVDIRRAVAAHYGLTDADMVSHDRHRRLARPRQVAMYLARELTGRSYPELGRMFNRDHSTVVHARDCIAHRRTRNPRLGSDIFAILGMLPA